MQFRLDYLKAFVMQIRTSNSNSSKYQDSEPLSTYYSGRCWYWKLENRNYRCNLTGCPSICWWPYANEYAPCFRSIERSLGFASLECWVELNVTYSLLRRRSMGQTCALKLLEEDHRYKCCSAGQNIFRISSLCRWCCRKICRKISRKRDWYFQNFRCVKWRS